jgi:cob(I)alamin adenosyltransferase
VVRLTKIYTRGGDKGKTSLGDGTRVCKSDPRIIALCAIDEANATIGLVRLDLSGHLEQMIRRIQNDLFDLGADICLPVKTKRENPLRLSEEQVKRLEKEIDTLNKDLSPLTSFVLPGGTKASTHLHLARTVTRRAECAMISLNKKSPVNPLAIQYINRLSDLLFVLARTLNDHGNRDVLWVPGEHHSL